MKTKAPLLKGMNLWAILGPCIGGFVLMTVGVVMILIEGSHGAMPAIMTGVLVVVAGLASYIVGIVFYYMMLYRAWSAIQDMKKGTPRTTPGKAVGFLFIPFFNFYWIFVGIYGLAQDYNRYIAEKKYDLPKMSEGLFLASCVLRLCAMIPYLGLLVSIGHLVVIIIVCVQISSGLNGIVAIRNNE